MKIAVTRLAGGCGDVVTTMPALQALSQQGHDVAYFAPEGYKAILEAAGLKDRVKWIHVSYDERAERDEAPDPIRRPYLKRAGPIDRYIPMFCPAYQAEKTALREHRPPPSRVRSFCEAAGVPVKAPSLFARPEWKAFAAGWLTSKVHRWEGKVVCIQPFATSPRRSWPAERWRTVIKALKDSGAFVVALHSCYGPRPERNEPDLSSLGAHCYVAQSWENVLGMLSHANLVVTVDSACLHLAAALGKRTVGIFGPTDGPATCELYPTVQTVTNDVCERPCYLLTPRFIDKCLRPKDSLCERFPSAEQVLNLSG